MLRLSLGMRRVGSEHHRSGWPWVMRSLEVVHSYQGIYFEDFVDRTFTHGRRTNPYIKPWVGVFHNPHNMPPWFDWRQTPQLVFQTRVFRESLKHLKLAIALSDYLGDWLRENLEVPVIATPHPTEVPATLFDPNMYLHNTRKKAIQVGWWLRNTDAIYQLKCPGQFQRTALKLQERWVKEAESRVSEYWEALGTRSYVDGVVDVKWIENAQYDKMLSRNVVFVEFFDSSANNAVVECIARNTPIIVNRHPAIEEYLGADYPLFYEKFSDAGDLFTDEQIIKGHEYLRDMDMTRFTGAHFRSRIVEAVKGIT